MQLTLERFGGLAGVPAKPLVVETAALPEQRAQQLEDLARTVLAEGSADDGPQNPDAFGYELTIESAQGRRVISFDYASASDALKQLVQAMRA